MAERNRPVSTYQQLTELCLRLHEEEAVVLEKVHTKTPLVKGRYGGSLREYRGEKRVERDSFGQTHVIFYAKEAELWAVPEDMLEERDNPVTIYEQHQRLTHEGRGPIVIETSDLVDRQWVRRELFADPGMQQEDLTLLAAVQREILNTLPKAIQRSSKGQSLRRDYHQVVVNYNAWRTSLLPNLERISGEERRQNRRDRHRQDESH